jgi:hypothetical protein
MSGLKLKWDASRGKTMHEGALVLVGFMWSLSVLTRIFSLFSLWSEWLSSSAIFSENDKDTLQSLPLNVRDQTLMHVYEENKRKKKAKENETKQKKQS